MLYAHNLNNFLIKEVIYERNLLFKKVPKNIKLQCLNYVYFKLDITYLSKFFDVSINDPKICNTFFIAKPNTTFTIEYNDNLKDKNIVSIEDVYKVDNLRNLFFTNGCIPFISKNGLLNKSIIIKIIEDLYNNPNFYIQKVYKNSNTIYDKFDIFYLFDTVEIIKNIHYLFSINNINEDNFNLYKTILIDSLLKEYYDFYKSNRFELFNSIKNIVIQSNTLSNRLWNNKNIYLNSFDNFISFIIEHIKDKNINDKDIYLLTKAFKIYSDYSRDTKDYIVSL